MQSDSAATNRWRWLLGWVGPLCLGAWAAIITSFWDSSPWIVIALVIGALIGHFDPWDAFGRRRA